MPKRRLGVALLVPPPTDRDVDALRLGLRDPALGRIPAHLTLVPPVNVRADEVDAAAEVLRAAAAATRPFTAVIGPPATFLPANPVAYLALTVGVREVEALRARVFRAPLERPVTWPFVPHVTIADEAEPARIEAALTALAGFRRSVLFDRVHLLREQEGRRWVPVGDWAFGAPAVVGRGGLALEVTRSQSLDEAANDFAEREWSAYDRAAFGAPFERRRMAFTARRDGEVVGVATGYAEGDRAHLSELLVAAACRGEGVGAHLLAAFEAAAREAGATWATLSTLDGGPAEGFYAGRGWRRDVVESAAHFGRDFVRMVRRLA